MFHIKFIYSEKDTKIWGYLQILFEITYFVSFKKILSYFCDLLRVYEVYNDMTSIEIIRYI